MAYFFRPFTTGLNDVILQGILFKVLERYKNTEMNIMMFF